MKACEQFTYPNYEIIVVDNAPIEDLKKIIDIEFPQITQIITSENLGFAGANNVGIKAANGDYLCFLNNDTIPTPDLLDHLKDVFSEDETIGGVSPMILYNEQKDVIQYAGYTEINPWTGRNKTIGQGEKEQAKFLENHTTAYLHGAAMMIKREVVEKTGGIPEAYFLYYEELDWSMKIRNLGYRLAFQPKGKIFHQVSASIGKESTLKTYYYHRNRILFMRRNGKGISLAFFLMYTLLIIIPRHSFTYLLSGRFSHLKAFWKGMFWHLLSPRVFTQGN